ncbi:uncharacterized protein LOC143425993 [Xylocopa sonorina]|uniref:uncharacterized protein LOC143425993 n=1 Tax=Xylocopa sonorina TaxID=1818115 RepID=UPI00403A9C62
MANYEVLFPQWATLGQKSPEYWSPSDLQLGAEFCKTLLERTKKLENATRKQTQENEYIKRQMILLEDKTDSVLKSNEQLHAKIQNMKRENCRNQLENTDDKEIHKRHYLTAEALEAQGENLRKKLQEINRQHKSLLRKQTSSLTQDQDAGPSDQKICSTLSTTLINHQNKITELLRQLQKVRIEDVREQKNIADLAQQLAVQLEKNNALQKQLDVLRGKAQNVKILQVELTALEEVRQHQLCGQCLQDMKSKIFDDSQQEPESPVQDLNDKHEASNDLTYTSTPRVTPRREQDTLTASMSPTVKLEMSRGSDSITSPALKESQKQQELMEQSFSVTVTYVPAIELENQPSEEHISNTRYLQYLNGTTNIFKVSWFRSEKHF